MKLLLIILLLAIYGCNNSAKIERGDKPYLHMQDSPFWNGWIEAEQMKNR